MSELDISTHRLIEPPVIIAGEVIKGFGRGGKLLGCPTANLPIEGYEDTLDKLGTGIYLGWAYLRGETVPMVASIGWNPQFANEMKTIEPHLLKEYADDFYGEVLRIKICGYIRDEKCFDSLGSS